MMDERFGSHIGGMVREHNPVPETPVEEIWGGVMAARRYRSSRPAVAWRPRLVPALAMAATLVIGIAIGRTRGPAVKPIAVAPPVAANEPAVEAPPEFRMAAADYLARTEALLAAFPSGAREGRTPEVAAWAKQLLLDTRLLLDSPAATDEQLAPLLSDLELVLAQIAALRPQDQPAEIELIKDGIAQNRVLARVRLAAGAAAGANGDD